MNVKDPAWFADFQLRYYERTGRLPCLPIYVEDTVKVKFRVTFKKGPKVVAEVVGDGQDVLKDRLGDVVADVLEAEQTLERLTGLRVHINQEHE